MIQLTLTFGCRYNLRRRELHTTDTDLCFVSIPSENQRWRTHDKAIARDAQTGLRRTFPAGYITPAAIGRAIQL